MKSILLVAASAAALTLSVSAAQAATAPAPAAATAPSTAVKHYGKWGIDLPARDTSVKPGDSFFSYNNGAWYKTAVIPNDQNSLSVGTEVYNLSRAQLRTVI